MPNVLILGGTGFLGSALGSSLLRAGTYAVWGTARTTEKGRLLAANEITPVECDITDPATLSTIIAANHIDIVVDTTSAYEAAGSILTGVLNAATARKDALAKENMVGPRLGFIYISGSFVHGSPTRRISDLSPVDSSLSSAKPARGFEWRPGHEQAVLAARNTLDVAVLRPSAIYGRDSWVWSHWWGGLMEAAKCGDNDSNSSPILVPADIDARIGVIHVDDAAAACHAVIDRLDGRLGSWPVFDLVTETLSVVNVMEASKAALGVTAPLEYVGTNGNPFLEALGFVSNSDASRAKIVLGWEPMRIEFILNIATYVKAWQASQK